jgi:Leucine-rich repeat (LRR) protein
LNSAREVTGNDVSASSRAVFVYEGISFPDDTRILDLSGMDLSGSLKAEVRQLNNLEVLDISNNKFTGLPAEVGQLSKLKVLNLANNPLTGLPHEIGNLKNLETLDLKGTNYSSFDLEQIKKNLPSSTAILTDTQ